MRRSLYLQERELNELFAFAKTIQRTIVIDAMGKKHNKVAIGLDSTNNGVECNAHNSEFIPSISSHHKCSEVLARSQLADLVGLDLLVLVDVQA